MDNEIELKIDEASAFLPQAIIAEEQRIENEENRKSAEATRITNEQTRQANEAARIKNNVLSVNQFGAKGDGITDDTVAIKSAIDYCKENNVGGLIFTDGTYIVSSKLTIDFSNFELYGTKKSLIKYKGSGTEGNIIEINGTVNNYIENISIHDLNIDGTLQTYKGGPDLERPTLTSTAPYAKGLTVIRGGHVHNLKIYNNNINDFYGDGIVLTRTYNNKIYKNTLLDCSGGNPRSSETTGWDNFGDGITIFASWNCDIDNNTVINKRVYKHSNTATDVGKICGRSGVEYEYPLNINSEETKGMDLFIDNVSNGLRLSNNYVYGYTKGGHFESKVEVAITNNTFIHNNIGCIFSTAGICNVTNNHFDDDNVGAALQSGYDSYYGGIGLSSYGSGFDIRGDYVISNNVFRGKAKGITIGRERVIISNNTFYNEEIAIYSLVNANNIKIMNNCFYDNFIYAYGVNDWIVSGNIFENETTECFKGEGGYNLKFLKNTFKNSVTFNGIVKDVSFIENTFKTETEIATLKTSDRFINIYDCKNLKLINNFIDLSKNDTSTFMNIGAKSIGIEITGNTLKATTNRTNHIIIMAAEINNLIIKDNYLYDLAVKTYFINHKWNLKNISVENNTANDILNVVYYQANGSVSGKTTQFGNICKVRFNQTPNNSLSKFVNEYFTMGEIMHNMSNVTNIVGYKCTRGGMYVTDSRENKEYSIGAYIVSSNYVYRCEKAGNSTVAPTITTYGEIEETSDGLEWLCCGLVATLAEI